MFIHTYITIYNYMLSLLGKHGQTPSNYFKGWGAGYLTLAMERRMW